MQAHHRGFTLIELSIVLVIISLIAGGIVAGRELIHQAELRKTVKQVEQFDTAVNTFRGKYNCLPGDCSNPSMFGFTGADHSSGTHPAITNDPTDENRGNGDGKIFNRLENLSTLHYETYKAFWWLKEASYLQVPGVPYTVYGAPHVDFTAIATGLGGRSYNGDSFMSVWLVGYMDQIAVSNMVSGNRFFPEHGHYYWLTTQASYLEAAAAISPADAFAIDVKLDDGLPRAGRVLASGNDMVDFTDGNLIPVFVPQYVTETGPNSCIASENPNTPPFTYNVANTLRDYGNDNGTGVGAMCTLGVKAGF